MLIRNINILDENNKTHPLKNLYIHNGRRKIIDLNADLSPILKKVKKIVDAKGKYTLMPGMLDAHVHGQGGFDFADVSERPEALSVITKTLGKTGLSYVMATLVSLELPTLKNALRAIDHYVLKQQQEPTKGSAKIVGIHLEGPFIAKDCRGAHAEKALQASISIEQFKTIISAAPHIHQWKITLSPDIKGAYEFIKNVKKLESAGIFVKVFIGHTNPKEKNDIDKAIAAGAMGFTHLGNACQETCCRETVKLQAKDAKSHVVQWVFENPEKCPPGVELIVDGIHLSQSFVALVKSIVGNKIVLVTDALGPSGLNDGQYKLGTLPIYKKGNSFYLMEDTVDKAKILAGSSVSLSYCAKTYFEWTAGELDRDSQMQSLYSAVIHNPRITSLSIDAILNLPDDKNFVMFDRKGHLVMSMCNGVLRSKLDLDR